MVGTPGPLAPSPRGLAVDIFYVDGGPSQTSITYPQGARHQWFLCCWWAPPDLWHHLAGGPPSMFFALMVGGPGHPAAPFRGLAIDIFCIDSGRSRSSSTASHGANRRCFFLLMVGAPGPPAALSHPVLGPKLNAFLYECQDQVSHIKRQVVK
jgi:hypothetical protein